MRWLLLGVMLLSVTTWAKPVVVVHGDSLSAAYGLPKEQGWVSLLQKRCSCLVINTSQSGETTAGGLARLPMVLKTHKPNVLVIELGANDGLRGLSLKLAEDNLAAMIKMAQVQKVKVMLVETALPPNMGKIYTEQFTSMFDRLDQLYALPAAPFLMNGFAADINSFQKDGLHPIAAKQMQMLENVWPVLSKLMR